MLRRDRQVRDLGLPAQVLDIIDLTADRVDALQQAEVLDWARESRSLRDYVYRYPAAKSPGGVVLDEAYLAGAGDISMRRLSEAGVRLAGMLNGLFCSRAAAP